MADALVDKRKEFEAKQGKLAKALEEARTADGVHDFTKVKCLDGETTELKVEAFQKLHAEVGELATEVQQLVVAAQAADVKRWGDMSRTVAGTAVSPPTPRTQIKSMGQLAVENEQAEEFFRPKSELKGYTVTLDDVDIKTLFQTGGGWAPESLRTGKVVEAVTRPIQILELIPSGDTAQPSVVYLEETLRTHAAAERAEGGTYAESAFELTERSSQVRSIGDSLPVTDEQLEDVAQVRSYIDGRLMFGARQRLDGQVLNGNGTSPNLRGILQVAGIQTQAKGALPTFDAVHYAMTKVRVTGRAFPNALVFHPNDWQDIRLTRTADGIYIMGNPADPGPMQLFGLPVALSDAIAENTGLVGDFANHCQLWNKRGITIEVGYSGTQFVEGKRTIRASLRAAFTVYRPAAFATITGI